MAGLVHSGFLLDLGKVFRKVAVNCPGKVVYHNIVSIFWHDLLVQYVWYGAGCRLLYVRLLGLRRVGAVPGLVFRRFYGFFGWQYDSGSRAVPDPAGERDSAVVYVGDHFGNAEP